LRLAILGDELTCAAANDHALPHGLHLQLPAMQVCDLSKPNFGPREYSRCGLGHLRGACPDVLLVFFSVGQDVATMPLESDWFDWRHLKLADVARSWCHAIESTEVALPSPRDTGALIRELAVCHAPSDEATDLRWKKALTHVGRLHRQCQRANVEMVLVAVPADFQLNGVLLESLRRQAGYARDSVDLTLPQRRLASFAADHQLVRTRTISMDQGRCVDSGSVRGGMVAIGLRPVGRCQSRPHGVEVGLPWATNAAEVTGPPFWYSLARIGASKPVF
jgi:hypothetical protein